MRLWIAILDSLLPIAVSAFCVFGFLATFEPTENTFQFLAFRIAYAIIGICCLVGTSSLIAKVVRK